MVNSNKTILTFFSLQLNDFLRVEKKVIFILVLNVKLICKVDIPHFKEWLGNGNFIGYREREKKFYQNIKKAKLILAY